MSKSQQVKFNIELSEKLANYLVIHPDILKKYSGASFIVISAQNKKLNQKNLTLIKALLIEGKQVVKAIEPPKSTFDWKFKSIN